MRTSLAVLWFVLGALADITRSDDSIQQFGLNGGGRSNSRSSVALPRSRIVDHETRFLQDDQNSTTTMNGTEATSPPSTGEDGATEAPTGAMDLGGSGNGTLPEDPSPTSILDQPTLSPTNATGDTGEETPAPSEGTAGGNGEGTPTPFPSASGLTAMPSPAPSYVPPPYAELPTWPTKPPHVYAPPTEKPTAEYIPPDDDPVKQEEEEENEGGTDWNEGGEESLEQLERDQRIQIALGVIGGVVLLLLICVAHQMLENPDGCCASICRIMVACTCALVRCVCFPCRMMCGCTGKDRRGHDLIQEHSNGGYTHDLELS